MKRSNLLVLSIAAALIYSDANAEELIWPDQIDSFAEQMIEASDAVGISIAVGIDGQIAYARAFGSANLEHRVPLQTDSLMRIGSITKQFTAAAILLLIEDGKLSLDTTLAEALPDWPIPIDPISGAPVNIEQMLTHTSGLSNISGLKRFDIDYAARHMTMTERADLIRDKPFTHKPGTEWRYSNTAYVLLGDIIERVSESELGAFFQDALFAPAGLELTCIDQNRAVIPNRAQGYDITPDGIFQDYPIEMLNVGGGGAVLSTPSELVKWTYALSSGNVVPLHIYESMASAKADTSYEGWAYGYGLLVDSTNDRSRIFHTGGINGFNTLLAHYLPTESDPRDIVVAVICNGTEPDARVFDRNATVAEARIAQIVLSATE